MKMDWNNCSCKSMGSCSNATYGLGLIGAAIYFWTTSPMLMDKFIGLLKAIVWPAYVAFHALKFFGV